MNRRRFIGAAALGLTSATAGCGIVSGTTRLDSPMEESDDDGREKHLVFEDDGQRVAEFSIDQRTVPEDPIEPFMLRLHLSHRSSENEYENPTTVEGVRFHLRTTPTAESPPAAIYVQPPRSELADVLEYVETEEGWTRIALEEAGELGEGTINVGTIVAPVGDRAEQLDVRVAATLSESGWTGTTYEIRGDTHFDVIGPE